MLYVRSTQEIQKRCDNLGCYEGTLTLTSVSRSDQLFILCGKVRSIDALPRHFRQSGHGAT